MATSWTNAVSPGTPIRAFDIQEVINAINSNRSSAGLQPYPWTDPPVSTGTPIKAVHFTEMRAALQALWSSKSMGAVPNWTGPTAPAVGTPIRASHLTDPRGWVNQYEYAVRANNPKRGMHLRNSNHRSEDYWALNEYNPGSITVMSRQLVDWDPGQNNWAMSDEQKALANWMKARCPYPNDPNHPSNMEIFVRIYPSPQNRPIYNQPFEGRDNNGIVNEIFRVYDKVKDYNGLVISRYLPGNEPNTEWWPGQPASTGAKWDTIANYYTDVYSTTQANKGTRNIELYTPPMAQENYAEEKNIRSVPPGEEMRLDTGELGGYNRQSYKDTILLYNSFSWHQYFFQNNAWQHRIEQYFPQWLQQHLWVNLAPARITECGWHPEDATDRDTTSSPTYWDDMDYFMRTATQADGVIVWWLSSHDCTEPTHKRHVAVKDAACWGPGTEGEIRRWIRELAVIAP